MLKGVTGWHYRPFLPPDRAGEKGNPYICRLAPSETGVEVEALEPGAALHIRKKDTREPWRIVPMEGCTTAVGGLSPDTDYELFAQRADGARGRLRYARTGFYPDRVVNYLHPQDGSYAFSGKYLCSPALARAPSGALIAGMDIFEGGGPQDLTLLFRSEDNGRTWRYLCDLFPAYWGSLFVHRGVLYNLCTHTENGHVLIGASYDEGFTWTRPSLLFAGGNGPRACGFQRQPMPIVAHGGRIVTSIDCGAWSAPTKYGAATLFAPEDADLLDPASWTVSDITYYGRDWPGSPAGGGITLLEGSVFEAGDGRLVNLLRMEMHQCAPSYGKACLLELDPDDLGAAPSFLNIIDMPTGANSRTHILRDPAGGKYWGIGNLVTNPAAPRMRSVLALTVSDDGYGWRTAKILLDYSDRNPAEVGFQYTSFIFDGDDILYLSRTAFNGAHNFHDANCQTFGVVKGFRKLG
ncbi:MAG: glycoside hydrolase [Oscillospiraceae bacterium]|jgi:hypothetical protein|nr:glycoside hydrolase [Oscillospiraceae bacterium]